MPDFQLAARVDSIQKQALDLILLEQKSSKNCIRLDRTLKEHIKDFNDGLISADEMYGHIISLYQVLLERVKQIDKTLDHNFTSSVIFPYQSYHMYLVRERYDAINIAKNLNTTMGVMTQARLDGQEEHLRFHLED